MEVNVVFECKRVGNLVWVYLFSDFQTVKLFYSVQSRSGERLTRWHVWKFQKITDIFVPGECRMTHVWSQLKYSVVYQFFNPFFPNISFLYKTFSDVFSEYRNGTLGGNGLITSIFDRFLAYIPTYQAQQTYIDLWQNYGIIVRLLSQWNRTRAVKCRCKICLRVRLVPRHDVMFT